MRDRGMTRRAVLRAAGGGAGLLVAGCRPLSAKLGGGDEEEVSPVEGLMREHGRGGA
ncbi:MAG TPA: hypothetical protein VFD84_14690 [Candidatus Binatia bacterium]|jgi:hypothetical protein|nr:hypothetical protein [Candidatus Binatia bacterium]